MGEIAQVPPATSAIKVDGKRAYALARAGVAVDMPSREVHVHALDVVAYDAALGRAVLDVHCSKGTYVRSLARDLGEALGCGAYCAELRRLAIGHLAIERAGTLDAVAADPLGGGWRMSCSDALAHLPARELRAGRARRAAARPRDRGARGGGAGALPRRTAGSCASPARRAPELRSLVVVDEAMRIVEGLEALEAGPRVIALGTFDGVHLGHKRLIHEALERAQELGAISTVATFEPMPSEILRPGQVPRRLSGIDRRAELIAEEGVDELLVIAFTHELSLLSPEAFAEQVLVGQAGAVHVVVGENYRFGHAAEGDADTLIALGEKLGFGVTSVSLVTADGERVSSSWIRELVRQGEVMHATRLLGRAPWLDGTVVRGFARGRALGVPTANLRWTPGRVVPAPGIYAGFGVLGPGEGERYAAAISVGGNPTFGDVEGTVVEAYLIGFDGDAYDRPLRVEFTRFLRHELAFETVEELVEQMWRDIETARGWPRSRGGLALDDTRTIGVRPLVHASKPVQSSTARCTIGVRPQSLSVSSFDSSRSAR